MNEDTMVGLKLMIKMQLDGVEQQTVNDHEGRICNKN